jgi:hypothetical protein
MLFEEWFENVLILAKKKKCKIAKNNPESYREYFEDDDSPETVIEMELSFQKKKTQQKQFIGEQRLA